MGGGSSTDGMANGSGGGSGASFRSATPNAQQQPYNDAVLEELESQNEAQVAGISAKVRMLKDVSGNPYSPFIPTCLPTYLMQKEKWLTGVCVCCAYADYSSDW